MYKRFLVPVAAFLLIQLPGAIDAWISLFDRFRGQDTPMPLDAGSIYRLASLPLGLFVLLAGIWWINRRDDQMRSPSLAKSKVEFYEDRTAMVKERGGIDNELDEAKEAWVAFESGHHFNTMAPERRKKITRLILVGPDTALARNLADALGDKWGTFEAAVRQATDFALREGVDVRWSSLPLLNIIIGNPDGDAWARFQTYLPYTQAAHWPNTVITKSGHPKAFVNIKESYERLWNKSQPVRPSNAHPEGSQP